MAVIAHMLDPLRRELLKLRLVLVACALLAASCARPEPPHSANPESAGPRLQEPEVIRIAAQAAVKHGYDLGDYTSPQVHYQFVRKDRSWSVFYDGKDPKPGHHFEFLVDDRTGATQVLGGE